MRPASRGIRPAETERPDEPFRLDDGTILASPATVEWATFLRLATDLGYFMRQAGSPRMPAWKASQLHAAWLAHHGCGTPGAVRRAAFLTDRYRDQLEVDFQTFYGLDYNALWQSRQIRRLLNLVDYLPHHSLYAEAVANDPEHMAALVEARGDVPADKRPRQSTWTPEVEAITQVGDLLKSLIAITVMVNSKKGSKKPDTSPLPRPGTVVDDIKRERKRKKHLELVREVLPHKEGSA